MCIRLVKSDEKILITVPRSVSPDHMKRIAETVDNFKKNGNVLVLNDTVYIIKDGEQVLLEDEVNQ